MFAQGQNGGSAASAKKPVAPCPPQSTPSTQGGFYKWWNDPCVQKALGLAPEKIKRIDDFFEKRSKDMKPTADELQRQTQELDDMTRAAVVDEATYSLQVLRVESLLSRLRESRTVMIYRSYRELQPEQNRKLQEILDQRRRMNANAGGNTNPSGRGRE